MGDEDQPVITVPARMATFGELLAQQAAKDMYMESIRVLIDFYKTMLTASTTVGTLLCTAIPILLLGDKDAKYTTTGRLLLLTPVALMLLSVVCFACGFKPYKKAINPNSPSEIHACRQEILASRGKFLIPGMACFLGGVLLAVGMYVYRVV